ncbi:MAG: hypothetical protein WBP08_10180 [Saprospiraceae bacterium]
MNNQQKYRDFFRTGTALPVFFHPDWLDITSKGGSWDVALTTDKSGDITAILPYYITKKYGQRAIIMPHLTPYGGIYIVANYASKTETYIKNEKEFISELISYLPENIVYYSQSYFYNFNNWLPFYWKGYQQTTRYSFVINDLRHWTIDNVSTNIRNKIKKADQELEIITIDDPSIIYKQIYNVLYNKDIHLSLSLDTFLALDRWLKSEGKRLMLGAVDSQGNIHASIYLLFDLDKTYSLIIGSDISLRQSGAVPFVIYHAIKESSKRASAFDFEGSMLESLFDLFAGFGGTLTPYYRIYKAKNIFWDIAYRIKSYYDKSNR